MTQPAPEHRPSPTAASAVGLRGAVKRFGPVTAVGGVDLDVQTGSVHALVGENGAGKSTVMSLLYGLQHPDEGQVLRRGTPVQLRTPLDAIAAGIGMVHQHFRLFEPLTVAENVVYRAEPTRRGLLDARAAVRRVEELSERFGLSVDPRARVGSLPLGVRQRVEILKALHREADVLLLDEPTAVLTPAEVTSLLGVLRAMADAGTAVVLVTHKVEEVLAFSDRITVMRDGRVSGRFTTAGTSAGQVVEAMIGRGLDPRRNPQDGLAERLGGREVLRVRGLRVDGAGPGAPAALAELDLVVRAGEVLGVAGVSGNGQRELVESVVGLRRPDAGSVELQGRSLDGLDVRGHREAGIAYVPEDRPGTGTAATLTVAHNLALGHHRRPPLARRGWLSPARVRSSARAAVQRLRVRTAGVDAPLGSLSGGNAQKVVMARELAHEAALLVVEQPTQGVDVGAGEQIHGLLLERRAAGGAVLLVSYEISELQALADRVVVFSGGRVTAELDGAAATEEALGRAMAATGATAGAGAGAAAAAPSAGVPARPAPGGAR